MLLSMKSLRGYRVRAEDSMAGNVRDFLFDDDSWTVRHMLVETRSILFRGDRAAVGARFLGHPDWEARVVPVSLPLARIRPPRRARAARPSVGDPEFKPKGARARGSQSAAWQRQGGRASEYPRGDDPDSEGRLKESVAEVGLRGCREVIGYRIDAVDGYAGRVRDFIVDDESWSIRYVVIDTGRWLPGRKVLVIPLWIEGMTWAGRTARIGLHRAVIAASRRYAPSAPVNREHEVRLYDYYGRPKRWR